MSEIPPVRKVSMQILFFIDANLTVDFCQLTTRKSNCNKTASAITALCNDIEHALNTTSVGLAVHYFSVSIGSRALHCLL